MAVPGDESCFVGSGCSGILLLQSEAGGISRIGEKKDSKIMKMLTWSGIPLGASLAWGLFAV